MVAEPRRKMDPDAIDHPVPADSGDPRHSAEVCQKGQLLLHDLDVDVSGIPLSERPEPEMARDLRDAVPIPADEAQEFGVPVCSDFGEGDCRDRIGIQIADAFFREGDPFDFRGVLLGCSSAHVRSPSFLVGKASPQRGGDGG